MRYKQTFTTPPVDVHVLSDLDHQHAPNHHLAVARHPKQVGIGMAAKRDVHAHISFLLLALLVYRSQPIIWNRTAHSLPTNLTAALLRHLCGWRTCTQLQEQGDMTKICVCARMCMGVFVYA